MQWTRINSLVQLYTHTAQRWQYSNASNNTQKSNEEEVEKKKIQIRLEGKKSKQIVNQKSIL